MPGLGKNHDRQRIVRILRLSFERQHHAREQLGLYRFYVVIGRAGDVALDEHDLAGERLEPSIFPERAVHQRQNGGVNFG